MKIITVGHKMPTWISEGFYDYQKRLTKPWNLELLELNSSSKINLLPQDFCVALDVQGKSLSTEDLAKKLESWQGLGKNLCFVIGGADGLDDSVINRADFLWSLSPLTFPHQLVKVMLAEQLYRAVSILQGHPYHRI